MIELMTCRKQLEQRTWRSDNATSSAAASWHLRQFNKSKHDSSIFKLCAAAAPIAFWMSVVPNILHHDPHHLGSANRRQLAFGLVFVRMPTSSQASPTCTKCHKAALACGAKFDLHPAFIMRHKSYVGRTVPGLSSLAVNHLGAVHSLHRARGQHSGLEA